MASILDRLRVGQVLGTDWIVVGGRPILLAAHPEFAARMARGEIAEAIPLPPPTPAPKPAPARAPRRPLPWGRIASTFLGAGGIVALALLGWSLRGRVTDLARRTGEVVAPPPPSEGAAAPPAPLDPSKPPPDPLASVAAEVGPVEEPPSLLVAQAIGALAKGGPDAETEAFALARRAVARSTADPDAVALLAVLAAWKADAGLTVLAGERAVTLGNGGQATQLGRAALALGNHDEAGAEAAVAPCAHEGDALCRYVAARAALLQPAHLPAGLLALDDLAGAWPQNLSIPRVAALAAVAADTPDAEGRLGALKATDPEVLGARGELALRNGDLAAAKTMAARLGDAAPVPLRIGVARVAVNAGEGRQALALVQGQEGVDRHQKQELRLIEAQARYLVATKDPATLPAAKESVTRLLELGRTDPAVSQVRALVAHLAGDRAEEAKAWDSMDTSRRSGPELARVFKTQAALLLDANVPGSEIQPTAEAARTADPSDPYTHVWVIHVHLLGHTKGKALEAMRRAIKDVDGQTPRRRSDLATLETGSPAKGLRAYVGESLGNDATLATQLPLAEAVASWLAGDLPSAKASLDRLPNVADTPEALALRARLRMAGKDRAGGLADWDDVVALRPKESAWLLGSLAAHVEAGKARESRPLAELVRASKNVNALAPAMLAEVAAANGDRPGAITLLSDALTTDPLDIRARARLTELRSGK